MPILAKVEALSAFNRRQFLKTFVLGGAAVAALRISPRLLLAQSGQTPETLPVPPSLMLHSRHRWRMEAMLEGLRELGFEGITYGDLEQALLGDLTLPEKPILITIDDLSPTRGSPSFAYFSAMKDLLVEYDFRGSFAIITRPDLEQDEAMWSQITGWLDDGIALETHTAYHSHLGRHDFTARDYAAEIVESAQWIRSRTGYNVRALVTPYGSGYNAETGEVLAPVLEACHAANLRFVVGIVGGRAPLPLNPAPQDIFYVGRVGPSLSDDAPGALYEMTYWQRQYTK